MRGAYDLAEEPARARRAHLVAARVTRSLNEALEDLEPYTPFTADWITSANRESKMMVDAFVKRFENVVEAGGKLFRAALFQSGDDHRGLAPSEIERRLESYGLLESAMRWRQLVGVRNSAAHDYAEDPEELAEALTEVYRAASEANRITRQLLADLRRRFPETSPREDAHD